LNAARILSRAGLDTHELRRELHPVRLEDVNVWPAANGVRLLWRSGVRGVTLWRVVLADPEMFDEEPGRLARFVIHELVHVRQFAELGYFRFMFRYIREYLQGRIGGQDHRTAYLAITAEEEAREVADRYL
jgi:tRNA-dihydrouridine synthase